MKRKIEIAFLMLCVFFAPLVFTACSNPEELTKNLISYNIELKLNEQQKTVSGSEKVVFVNRSDNTVKNVLFHLYPNAYREGAVFKPVTVSNQGKAYPEEISYGGIEILKVSASGKEVSVQIGGEDRNILTVPLESELYPNQKCEIEIDFELKLPQMLHRFGWHDDKINLGNFYPIVCYNENGVFQTNVYSPNGDPFFSDIADYKVSITAPKDMVIASSGALKSEKTEGNDKTSVFAAAHQRDFALVLSRNFKVLSDDVNGIKISYYYTDDEYASENLELSVHAIRTFTQMFGRLSIKTLAVVETGFLHGGMEYGGLVYINDKLLDVKQDYQNVIIHEIAHQWWYNEVGSNQVEHAWMDEALAEFSTAMFYKQNPELGIEYNQLIKSMQKSYLLFAEVYTSAQGKLETSMQRSIYNFNTEPEYTYLTYVKGNLMFDSMRSIIGEKRILRGMKEYFKQNKFKVARPENLISAFEKGSGRKLQSFFNAWILGNETICAA